jgi:hypothetical protein
MKPIRASDIGSYLYCHRAWWYRQTGQESANQTELSAGTELHRKHGHKVFQAGLYRLLAWLVLLVALALAVAWLTQYVLKGV